MEPRNNDFQKLAPIVSQKIWQTMAIFFVLFVAFGIYVFTEKRIDRANDLRQTSYQLADQLRQSSDDLTRMARTYVVTGNPLHKQHYQDILDIRDGKKRRPEGYLFAYWDLVLANPQSPRLDNGQAIALLELMRQTGFTDEEFDKLAEAKANSDSLTTLELEAMKLAESAGPAAEPNRARARLMLHDENHHRAKATIMKPINEFFLLMDKRTLAAVRAAEDIALLLRMIFIATSLATLFMLWRAYATLRATLGGSADEVHAQMLKIGRGDFSTAITVATGMENSVLAGLLDMQLKLNGFEIERKQAEEALLEGEQRFRDFSRSTADWFWEMDADLRFSYFSDNFESYYGVDRNQVLGKTRRELLATDSLNPPDILEPYLAQIERHEPFRDFYYRIRNAAGQICWFSISGVPVVDPNGQFVGYRGMGQNVTERKQAETDLRIAATAFQSQEGMMVTDTKGVILRVNRAFAEITGYTAEEAVGQTPRLLQSGRHDSYFYRKMWNAILHTGGWQGEIWDRRKNGEVYPKWLTISAVKDDVGAITHFVGTHSDITERKNADAAMLNLNRDLSESRQRLRGLAAQNEARLEGERKHIAQEVHDELGQVLTALRMDLSLLGMRFGSLDPAVNDKVLDMKRLVDRAILGVRNVAVNLRPTALDMGLAPAIEWLCNEFTRLTTIACVFDAGEESIDLDETRAVVIFRIVQESLTNITRYAHASQVEITLGLRGRELGLEVRDNGCGFDRAAAAKRKSFGLLGMRERALALGGRVDIISAPGKGTVIGVSIPIDFDTAKENP